MKTKKLEKNAEKNGETGRFGLYWAAVLAFWALAFALGVVRASELGASYPWGGIAVFALGALILSGPFLAVEICRSRSLGEFGANAGRILGAGFVGTVLGGVLGLYWAAPEELAVTLSVGDVFMDVVHEYPDLTVHLALFNATIAEGVPQKLEHNDIRWITPSEIPNYDFCPADEEILARICSNKNDYLRKEEK